MGRGEERGWGGGRRGAGGSGREQGGGGTGRRCVPARPTLPGGPLWGSRTHITEKIYEAGKLARQDLLQKCSEGLLQVNTPER